MYTKLLTGFLLLLMAAPEAFAQDRRGRRGNSVNRSSRSSSNVGRRSNRQPNRNVRTNSRSRGRGNVSTPSNRRNTNFGRNNSIGNTRNRVQTRRRTTNILNRSRIGNRNRIGNRRGVDRRFYGTRNYHRPRGYRVRNYSRFFHSPYTGGIYGHRSYGRYGYYNFLRASYNTHLYVNWVLSPSKRLNGYHYINNYPFYVHNGYRHRYSNIETCNYQLIDKNTHMVQSSYRNELCSTGYNSCAYERDSINDRYQENRYFCAENFKEDYRSTDSFNTPEADELVENDSQTCFDLDETTGECFDN